MPIIKDYKADRMKYRNDEDPYNYMAKIVLGMNVYHWRKYRGLSQQELAEKSKTTQSIISEMEDDESNPTMDVLSRIAKALQISVALLTKENFNWQFFEALDYFISKIKGIDMLKLMKLAYFADLEAEKMFGYKLTWLNYIRRYAWPFTPDIYIANEFFEKEGDKFVQKQNIAKRVALTKDEEKFLDKIVKKYWALSSKEIRDLSYTTKPMKWCTKQNEYKMGEVIF